MAASGARGSVEQIRQLAGMRGLMAKPSGKIIETPIKANFREGLRVLEYFSSTHGARKGLADTALKTADSGYLTRKLTTSRRMSSSRARLRYQPRHLQGCRVQGRARRGVAGDNIRGSHGAATPSPTSSPARSSSRPARLIDERQGARDRGPRLREGPRAFSALTCDTPRGVCATCYGMDLARGAPVEVGQAVGVIAAQSIGEPGTQLTMRTFHIGGTASRSVAESHITARQRRYRRVPQRSHRGFDRGRRRPQPKR